MLLNEAILCISNSDEFAESVVRTLGFIDFDLGTKVDRLQRFRAAADVLVVLRTQFLVIDLSLPEEDLRLIIETLGTLNDTSQLHPVSTFVGECSPRIAAKLKQLTNSIQVDTENFGNSISLQLAESGKLHEPSSKRNRELESQVAVRESELAFRSIFSQSAVGIAIVDSHTQRYIKVNDCFCKMTGFEVDELEQQSLSELAEDCQIHETLLQVLRLHADDFREFSFSGMFKRDRREATRATLTLTPAYFGADRNIQHFVILQEEKSQSEELESFDANQILERLVNAFPTSCCVLDCEFLLSSANSIFARQFGIEATSRPTVEELIGDDTQTQNIVSEYCDKGTVSFDLSIGGRVQTQFWISESGLFGHGDRVLWLGQGPQTRSESQPANSNANGEISRAIRYLGNGYWQLNLANDRIQFSPCLLDDNESNLGNRLSKEDSAVEDSGIEASGLCYSEWLEQFPFDQKKEWLRALNKVLSTPEELDCEVSFRLSKENQAQPMKGLKLRIVEQLNGGELVCGTFRFES